MYEGSSKEIYCESTQGTLSLTIRVYLHSFSRRWLQNMRAKSREIPREFELVAGQSHPRSSILVPIESAYASSY